MATYDVLGNIAIVKFKRGVKDKKKFALRFLKDHKNVRTVLEKTDRFKGRLRTLTTKHIAGEKTKEALYRENGCEFRLNVDSCYFSPRLASERKEIASLVKKGEKVLVMFGGVAPFAIVIAKHAKPAKVISVELGKECVKYAHENVKRNKAHVELIQGDVRKKVPLLKEKFDRIVMARPNLSDSFLDVAFPKIKDGGIIHYYGFYEEDKVGALKELLMKEAMTAKKGIKIRGVKKAGDIGPYKYRYRADVKVMD
ncbi:methyltransferase domain-containing protein [Candidatus Pacearchaeota archaeon]|nr:methyltransferase domain-containing protein [Candidatus Pacearchaeota archaeon]